MLLLDEDDDFIELVPLALYEDSVDSV